MAFCQISVALLGILIPLVAGNFRFESFKTFGLNDGSSKPLYDYVPGSSPYSSETQLIPRYYPYDHYKHGTEPIPAFKKIRTEDKAFKKSVPSFYTLSDSDDPKLKEIILKSGTPYCQEIAPKDTKTDMASIDQKQTTCYRCKDPKNGAIYEQCSYTSRPARSNAAAERTVDSLTSATRVKDSKKVAPEHKLPEPYGFGEDYFHPEASHDLPAEYEKNIDNCEKIVKDSMVCMVCKDPKTSGKYEQCSYVAQPNEKAFAYSKSSSFGASAKKPKAREEALKEVISKTKKEPERREEDTSEHESDEDHHNYNQRQDREDHHEPERSSEDEPGYYHSDDKEGHGSHYVPEKTYHYPSYDHYKGGYGSYEADDEEDASPKQSVQSKNGCKNVEKDGQSCTICTDPKTGAKSENCNYSHEPKDKVYKYSKSKSFGYPESQSKSSEGTEDDRDRSADSSEKQERESSGEEYTGNYHSEPSTLEYIKSESEKISQKVKDKGDCHKVKKDSMVCTVCKDPNTGGDFEQCNYSYEPDDKVYAFSKSKHFGSPTKDYDYSGSAEEKPEETYNAPVIYPTGTPVTDYIPKNSDEGRLVNIYTTKRPQEKPSTDKSSRVDTGFYDATRRRAEIEKIVKEIGAEDRTKCKKVFKNGMTCYRCTDDKGFTDEECVYVTEPELETKSSTHSGTIEATEPSSTITVTARPSITTSTTTKTTTTTKKSTKFLEPLSESTSWKTVTSKRKTRETSEKKPKDQDEELEVLDEERDEAEPYDYVAETRPVYDKVLGLTLPAYMVNKSPHEIEFDEIVEKSKF